MKRALQSLLSQKRIAGGALVLAITQFGASFCGFLRDQAFSIMFPLGHDPIGVASVYIAAFRPSDLLFQITVMSSLSVILVPFIASHLAHDRREEMDKITTSILIVFGGVFGALALILAIIFPWIAPYLTKFTGPSLALYISFGRMAFLTNALFVIGNTVGQYLISVQKYWVYGLTSIVWALCTVAGIYVLSPPFGPMGAMIGTLIGTVFFVLWRWHGAYRAGFRLNLSGSLIHPEIRQIGLLIIPRMMALGALQLQLLVLDRLGSGLGNQMVAVNQFASNFESVIPGFVGIAIAQSTFSLLSQAHAKGEHKNFRSYVRKAVTYNALLSIPCAIAMASLAFVAAWILRLDASVSILFQRLLMIYAIAIPFESINHSLLRSFYSLKNTGWPAITSVVSVICGIGSAYLAIDALGIYALAIGYIAAQIAQTICLTIALRQTTNRLTITEANMVATSASQM